MWPMAQKILADFVSVLLEMSPYLLLGFLAAGVMAALLPRGFIERHLGGGGFWPVLKAAALGVPLPLCSCSVLPVTASLRKGGASRGATLSFLISTPQTGVDNIAVTLGMLGWVFAVFRVVLALVSGMAAGCAVAIGDRHAPAAVAAAATPAPPAGLVRRIRYAAHYGLIELPRDVAKPMLAGLGIAALISALVPPEFFARLLPPGVGQVAVMMLAGIPIFVCATASVPIAAALIRTGVSPGAALAFLVTGAATNPATIALVYRMLGKRVAAIYLLTVAATTLGGGLVLDQLLRTAGGGAYEQAEWMPPWLQIASAALLAAMMGWALWGRRLRPGPCCGAGGPSCGCKNTDDGPSR